jgi:hypothetical protein
MAKLQLEEKRQPESDCDEHKSKTAVRNDT